MHGKGGRLGQNGEAVATTDPVLGEQGGTGHSESETSRMHVELYGGGVQTESGRVFRETEGSVETGKSPLINIGKET